MEDKEVREIWRSETEAKVGGKRRRKRQWRETE